MTDADMREPTFLLLTALASGPKHGYGLLQEIEKISGGRLRLRAGTLYGALDRLLADGLIGEAGEEIVEGRLRRYYELSGEGEQALSLEVRRLQVNVRVAARRLKARGVTA